MTFLTIEQTVALNNPAAAVSLGGPSGSASANSLTGLRLEADVQVTSSLGRAAVSLLVMVVGHSGASMPPTFDLGLFAMPTAETLSRNQCQISFGHLSYETPLAVAGPIPNSGSPFSLRVEIDEGSPAGAGPAWQVRHWLNGVALWTAQVPLRYTSPSGAVTVDLLAWPSRSTATAKLFPGTGSTGWTHASPTVTGGRQLSHWSGPNAVHWTALAPLMPIQVSSGAGSPGGYLADWVGAPGAPGTTSGYHHALRLFRRLDPAAPWQPLTDYLYRAGTDRMKSAPWSAALWTGKHTAVPGLLRFIDRATSPAGAANSPVGEHPFWLTLDNGVTAGWTSRASGPPASDHLLPGAPSAAGTGAVTADLGWAVEAYQTGRYPVTGISPPADDALRACCGYDLASDEDAFWFLCPQLEPEPPSGAGYPHHRVAAGARLAGETAGYPWPQVVRAGPGWEVFVCHSGSFRSWFTTDPRGHSGWVPEHAILLPVGLTQQTPAVATDPAGGLMAVGYDATSDALVALWRPGPRAVPMAITTVAEDLGGPVCPYLLWLFDGRWETGWVTAGGDVTVYRLDPTSTAWQPA